MNRQDVNREVQQMLGVVPGFLNAVPDTHVGPLWESMRKIQMEAGSIPAKYQQLMMLAVSAYAKCKYCMFFHTEVAKALGATREEITEAALLAGHTAHWSSFINGIQYDYAQFEREVRKACETLTANAGRAGAGATQRTTTAHH